MAEVNVDEKIITKIDKPGPDASSTTMSASGSSNSEKDERESWGHTAEFLLSTVGYAVGLGNLWRFPYLCYRNGGGAFLIPYFIFLFLCGIPLVFMEMSIGQFAGAGPLSVWSLCPLAKGLGMSMVIVSIYCCIYYNVIIMWTLYYLFNSFFSVLPWARCGNDWNSDECRLFGQADDESMVNGTYVNVTTTTMAPTNATVTTPEPKRPPYPAEEFWDAKVLSRSSGITEFVELRWDLALTLLLAWALVFLCLIKGIKSSGKVVYVTATLPYILLTILLIQGATMDGSIDGVKFYMNPNFERLKDPKVWAEACGQIFFSLGAAWGGLITMSSYNKFNTNIYRFSIAVPLINVGTSIYAGFVIFCVLGYMAKEAGVHVSKVADGGPGLIFVAYPYAISTLPLSQLWSVLFFLMVLTVGLDSQFGMFETFTTCIFDEMPNFFNSRARKMTFTGGICLVSYMAGLFCCSHAGIYFFQLMDWYIGIFTLLFVSLINCIIIGHVYGADRLYRDIQCMIGYKPVIIFKYMWQYVTPILIFVMLIYSLSQYKAPVYKDEIPYPSEAIGLAWLYGISSALPIPIYFAYLLFWKTRGEDLSIIEKIKKYAKPSPAWGRNRVMPVSVSNNEGLLLDDQHSQNGTIEDPEKQPLQTTEKFDLA